MSEPYTYEHAANDLINLGLLVRSVLRDGRLKSIDEQTRIARTEASDVIYQIDLASEAAILKWFEEHWRHLPAVELVMEGLESRGTMIFPNNAKTADWICIIDPIDGTRGIMYDKRSAWFIAGIAPIHRDQERPTLADLEVSVMVELPTSKAGYADHFGAVKGCRQDGLICQRINLFDGSHQNIVPQPFSGTDLLHGFATFCKFFPEGKALMARAETAFFESLNSTVSGGSPVVFDDQYISTAGQFYEILMGHDRMIADLRPQAYATLGIKEILSCHPYDVAGWLILAEAGCIIETPDGNALDAPLDTISPVSWVAYANKGMAEKLKPKLNRIIQELLICKDSEQHEL